MPAPRRRGRRPQGAIVNHLLAASSGSGGGVILILFLLIEGIMRRDVNQAVKERMYQVAVVCLILFMVFVMFNDITKLHLKP